MKLIREKTCCFTGHRVIPKEELLPLRMRLRREIRRLHEERGIEIFLAGGALGFDTLAAQEVLLARDMGVEPIYLVLVLPCLEQAANWPLKDARLYEELITQADEVIYTGDLYTEGCMHVRNRYVVDHSALCLAYCKNDRRGGTAYTVHYAERQGLEIINLAEGQKEGDKPNGTAADQMSWGRGPL